MESHTLLFSLLLAAPLCAALAETAQAATAQASTAQATSAERTIFAAPAAQGRGDRSRVADAMELQAALDATARFKAYAVARGVAQWPLP
jgi:hypothetical protein